MKTHIYIFNEGARGSRYGVGTYVNHLIDCFKDDASILLNIVLLGSESAEFTVNEDALVPVIHITAIHNISNPKQLGLYHRNAAYLLADYINIPASDRLIFHFNYLSYELLKNLKKLFPVSYSVYSIHLDSMCLSYKGNIRLVKDKLNQQQQNEKIYHEY